MIRRASLVLAAVAALTLTPAALAGGTDRVMPTARMRAQPTLHASGRVAVHSPDAVGRWVRQAL
ncbi:MAG: hypothetical protein QOF45_2528 [Gaiellaceae bacterium]|jgi:hypothetical protein|nr:hypothetical protein [Gaiellaceae bacterium]